MLGLIARVLEDVEMTGEWDAEGETVCAFAARMHGEHQRNVAIIAVKGAVAHCEVPVAAILRPVQIRDALEQALVAHPRGVAFHHHVESLVEGVAACGEDAVRVAREVLRFALALAGAKIQRAIQPDGEQRRDVRASLWAHRRQPVDLRRLLLGLGRATCRVSTGTTARLALPRAQILHLHRQGTAWEHRTMVPERQDIDRTHGVPWGRCTTMRATIDPALLAPLPAYGTRLRGIGFAEGNGSSCLVVQLGDELVRASSAHLLSLHPPDALGRRIERLPNVARRTGECLYNRVRGLVAQIADAPLRLVEQAILAALQSRVPARMLDAPRLTRTQAGEPLVTVLDRGLGRAPATFCPSVAASSVFTPKSTPMTACCGRASSGTSQIRQTVP